MGRKSIDVIGQEVGDSPKQVQRYIIEAMDYAQCSPSLSQAIRIRKMSNEGKLNLEKMEEILSEVKQRDVERVVFRNEQLYRFFPSTYTAEQMRREILQILKLWMENNWEN